MRVACQLVDTEPPAVLDVREPRLETVEVPGPGPGYAEAVVFGAKEPGHGDVRIRCETRGSAVAVAGAEKRRTVGRHELAVVVAPRNHHRGDDSRGMEERARARVADRALREVAS